MFNPSTLKPELCSSYQFVPIPPRASPTHPCRSFYCFLTLNKSYGPAHPTAEFGTHAYCIIFYICFTVKRILFTTFMWSKKTDFSKRGLSFNEIEHMFNIFSLSTLYASPRGSKWKFGKLFATFQGRFWELPKQYNCQAAIMYFTERVFNSL